MSRSDTTRPDPVRELVILIRSRHSLVTMAPGDRSRSLEIVSAAAVELGVAVFTWSATKGLRRTQSGSMADPSSVYATTDSSSAFAHIEASALPAIYVFEGVAESLAEPLRAQRLTDALATLAKRDGAIVLLDEVDALPSAFRAGAATIALPLPTPAEYHALIQRVLAELRMRMRVTAELEPADVQRMLDALRGLPLRDAEKVITRAIVEDGRLAPDDIVSVKTVKHATIKAAGLLEFAPVDVVLDDIADLESLKAWLGQRRAVVADPVRAAEAGLPFPRGMLLVGVPGCGKSMCAKAVAADWGLPLLKLDTSGIYDKYVGESEKRFLAAIKSAEDAGPCVLWIDEIEKAFASGGDSDGGVSTRILGTFLSWLQERRGDVFVVATANDIERLPAELIRKGRFDEIFFVDLPDADARSSIFDLTLAKRRLDAQRFDTATLAAATDGFSGAEIEQVVVSALYGTFARHSQLSMTDIIAEISRTRPLSSTMHERIDGLREWARERTVPAR